MLYRMLDFWLPEGEDHGDDALVVTMTIDYTGSSVNVIFKDTFKEMTIPWDRVIPYVAPLIDFAGQTIKSKGKISLPISVNNTAHMVEFLIFFSHLHTIASLEEQC